jgi:GGDEF domain-containing protein
VALITERFREKVENTIRVEERIVTISVGLAQVRWENGLGLEQIQARLVEEADQNLYTAKRNGRNQVHWQPVMLENEALTVPPPAEAQPSPFLSLPF